MQPETKDKRYFKVAPEIEKKNIEVKLLYE